MYCQISFEYNDASLFECIIYSIMKTAKKGRHENTHNEIHASIKI